MRSWKYRKGKRKGERKGPDQISKCIAAFGNPSTYFHASNDDKETNVFTNTTAYTSTDSTKAYFFSHVSTDTAPNRAATHGYANASAFAKANEHAHPTTDFKTFPTSDTKTLPKTFSSTNSKANSTAE